MKTVRTETVEQTIVACPKCGQKNRLYKRAQHGNHICGSCRTVLADPFNRAKAPAGVATIFAWLVGAAILVVIVIAITSNSPHSDSYSYSDSSSYQAPYTPPSASTSEPSASKPITELRRNSNGGYVLPESALTEDARRAIATLKQRGSRADAESVAAEIARAKANRPPALPTPPNGEAFTYTNQERIAPFEIKSSGGTNYLVKLATVSGQLVLTVFVRGGETVNIDVPVGTYVVKYASGDTWYGYKALFGPDTGYSKASKYFTFQHTATQVSGYTITLYKVPFGNLHTERIKPNEF